MLPHTQGVLLGLEYLHSRKLAHCDIKPDGLGTVHYTSTPLFTLFFLGQCRAANILLLPDGTPKLSDFGLSHGPGSSESSSEKGSLRYQPPEGGNPTFAADVWALGITLLEMLNGVDHRAVVGAFGCICASDPQDFAYYFLSQAKKKKKKKNGVFFLRRV